MRTFCAALFIVAMMAPASAYTDEQVSACTPDVMRLCSDAIPDEGRITKCMIQKKKQISAACMMVMRKGPSPRRASPPSRPPNFGSNGFHPRWLFLRNGPRKPRGPFCLLGSLDSAPRSTLRLSENFLHFFCYWAGIGAPVDNALARRG